MTSFTQPLLFSPVYQPYIWGGEKVKTRLHRGDTPPGRVAESWEVSSRKDGMSTVEGGPHHGKTFADLLKTDAAGLLGSRVRKNDFPLLIKVLDAAKKLSVQVHPNDETAQQVGGEAKTETWYILQADEEACVYCGIKEGVTPEQFKKAIADNALEPLLKKIPVKAGDAVFVPGGRVHAISEGCLILEVQQNSNTTYRIYDWGRVDEHGKGRELHIDKALQVSLFEDPEPAKVQPTPCPPLAGMSREKVMESDYFLLEKLSLKQAATLPPCPESFQVVFSINGALTVEAGEETVHCPLGRSVFIPAAAPETKLMPEKEVTSDTPFSGETEVIRITQPGG